MLRRTQRRLFIDRCSKGSETNLRRRGLFFRQMETRRLKRDLEALLGEYIGQKLMENAFDPKGRRSTKELDDLAHYDLAISVALWWLDMDDGQDLTDSDLRGLSSQGHSQYPNWLEREAMILSSFAGVILNSLPVEDILTLYTSKPSTSHSQQHRKSVIIHPFTLSYHPFAMLSSFKAVDHSRKHTHKLKRWRSDQSKPGASETQQTAQPSSSSSSSQSSCSGNLDSTREQTQHYDGSQESLQS